MLKIVSLNDDFRPWAHDLLDRLWGLPGIVTRGKLHNTSKLSGFVAIENTEPTGLITYLCERNECEIISLNSLKEKIGVGTALIEKITREAQINKCKRIVVITTNDNTYALRFFQKRGFHIHEIYPDALVVSRKLKPTIPLIGIHGIPLCDEIELEILL
ncbi:MAG: GNAT family N-acetyltransferase [Patescibacteria group bacterium]